MCDFCVPWPLSTDARASVFQKPGGPFGISILFHNVVHDCQIFHGVG